MASASSFEATHDALSTLDGEPNTFWAAHREDQRPWIAIDLGYEREVGGLLLDWVEGRHLADYDLDVSNDGEEWTTIRRVRGGNGGQDPLPLAEAEARHLRLRAAAVEAGIGQPSGSATEPATGLPHAAALREMIIEPPAWNATPDAFYRALAQAAPRGLYPRAILGEPSFWTVIGLPEREAEGLIDTDGRVETGKAAFSIEPFLRSDETLLTWADFHFQPSLRDGTLPIPSVRGRCGEWELTVTAFVATGQELDPESRVRVSPSCQMLVARYQVRNSAAGRRRCALSLALRPFQVNPPAQFLNMPGGVAPIRSIERDHLRLLVNGDREILSTREPCGFGAASFDQGDIVTDYLRHGQLPSAQAVEDPSERASAALSYHLDLGAGEATEVALLIALPGGPHSDEFNSARPKRPRTDESRFECLPLSRLSPLDSAVGRAEELCAARWGAVGCDSCRLGTEVAIDLPPAAREIVETIWAQRNFILVNRDGPGIQPGSRSYDRSWIRDGALTSTALLRLGHETEVRRFLGWFADHQYPDGKVPCCIDDRGADPVPEHDSHGEFIYLAAEYYRYTGDLEAVRGTWPSVLRAAAYIDTLRRQRRTPEWRGPDREQFFGLLPPSISHEGYSAKPMHSYWDDFWALRGLRDAVYLAEKLGYAGDAARLAVSRDEFTTDLQASVAAALRTHAIDYIPGCADLGDFDATSTTVALSPTGAGDILPRAALERTFERYWEFFRDRRDGKPWEAYTPYELRNVGAFVRLGWRDRAHAAIDFFLKHRTPPEWRQWAEVVWSDSTTQRFIGDLPHTWVGSDYIRSALDLLAYEDDETGALVLGAGVSADWLHDPTGVRVTNLRTAYGPLSYTAREVGGAVEVHVEGLRGALPPGGIVLDFGIAGRPATVNGRPAQRDASGSVTVREVPIDARI